MIPKAYMFNTKAKYEPGGSYRSTSHAGPVHESDIVTLTTFVTQTDSFESRLPNIFDKYVLPRITSTAFSDNWHRHPMAFWQNQLNFAIWCATTGCGVSYKDHIFASDRLTRAIYRFHIYYTVRRILAEMKCPMVGQTSWNALDNGIDKAAYTRICNEFGVSPYTDWKQPTVNDGMGSTYMHVITDVKVKDGVFRPEWMTFGNSKPGKPHVWLQQEHSPSDTWATFILTESNGFTRPGIERLNDSIRTYVWALLGAQAQTRSSAIGTGTAFDAQKQFSSNVEDAINSPVDLPDSIKRYQDVLRFARSKVDYAIGIGLYMLPSDMNMRIGTMKNYNNEIIVASPEQSLGLNSNVNNTTLPAGEKLDAPVTTAPPKQDTSSHTPGRSNHQDEMTALVIGFIGLTLLVFAIADRN